MAAHPPPGSYKDIDIRMTISTYIVKAIINATLGMGGRRRSYDRVHICASDSVYVERYQYKRARGKEHKQNDIYTSIYMRAHTYI
jgi:hypothetical protein